MDISRVFLNVVFRYPTINELVIDSGRDQNGLLFNTSDELAAQLLTTLRGFPGSLDKQSLLSDHEGGLSGGGRSLLPPWNEAWDGTLWPELRDLVGWDEDKD